MPTKSSPNIARNLIFKERDADFLKYVRRNLGSFGGSSLPAGFEDRVKRIELELSLPEISTNRFSKLSYNPSGDLSKLEIFEDNTESVKLYDKTFNYTLGDLTSIIIVRLSDNFTYTKNLSYDLSGNLISINII